MLNELTVLAPNMLLELCTFNALSTKPTDAPSALIAGLVPVIVSRVRSAVPLLGQDVNTQQLLRARVAKAEAVARLLLAYAAPSAPTKPQRIAAVLRGAVEAQLVPDQLAEAADVVRPPPPPTHTHTRPQAHEASRRMRRETPRPSTARTRSGWLRRRWARPRRRSCTRPWCRACPPPLATSIHRARAQVRRPRTAGVPR